MKAALAYIENIVCIIALAIMTGLTFANVIARYVFSASFSFSEEITTYLFVLLSLIGSAVAARRKAHLGFTALLDMAPAGVQRFLSIISFTLATLLSSTLFYFGLKMVMSQMRRGQITAGLQWPEWIFGAFVPLGAFFITIEFFFLLLEALKGSQAKEVVDR